MTVFIDQNRGDFGVEPICSILDVSASAYYHRKTGARSLRAVEDERLTAKLREIFEANYECYGYRRMHAAMLRAGERVSRDQVVRLMRLAGLRGAKRRGKPWKTTITDPGAQKRPDLVCRDFTPRHRHADPDRRPPSSTLDRQHLSASPGPLPPRASGSHREPRPGRHNNKRLAQPRPRSWRAIKAKGRSPVSTRDEPQEPPEPAALDAKTPSSPNPQRATSSFVPHQSMTTNSGTAMPKLSGAQHVV